MVRTWVACVLAASTVSAHAFDFSALLGDRRSEFCTSVLDGRITTQTTLMARQCEKVSPADSECKAKCDEMVAAVLAEEQQRRDAMRRKDDEIKRNNAISRAEFNGSMKNHPGREFTSADTYCATVADLPQEECESAFSDGARKADEKLALEQAAENKFNARIKTTSFAKAMNAIRIGIYSSSIDSSLKEQSRQRSIANQSGYINKSEMHRLGTMVVDGQNKVQTAFRSYIENGGRLKTPSSVAAAYKTCSEKNAISSTFISLAIFGFFRSQPTDDEFQAFASFENCV